MAGPASNPRVTPRYQKAWDAVVRTLLSSPLHFPLSRWMLVIEITGRRSGKLYRVPVGYVKHNGDLLVGAGGRWYRNLVSGQAVPIILRGRRQMARVEVVTDEAGCAELYRYILADNPVHPKLVGIRAEPDGAPNQSDLRRALAAGVAVVRLTTAT